MKGKPVLLVAVLTLLFSLGLSAQEDTQRVREDRDDKVYRIYFDDIRPLRDASNRADNVGLFLKIKFFGDAVAVEYAAP